MVNYIILIIGAVFQSSVDYLFAGLKNNFSGQFVHWDWFSVGAFVLREVCCVKAIGVDERFLATGNIGWIVASVDGRIKDVIRRTGLEEWSAVETKVVVVARVRVGEIAIGTGTDERLLATGYVGFSVASADIRVEDVIRWADLEIGSVVETKVVAAARQGVGEIAIGTGTDE